MKFVKLLAIILLEDWLAVIALLIAIHIGYSGYQEGFSRAWMPVSANIIKVSIVDTETNLGSGAGGGTSYSACLLTAYEYVIADKIYQSNRYSIDSLSEGCNPNKSELAAYKTPAINSKIVVWYDKDQPNYAVRVHRFSYAHAILIFISISIAIGMLIYLAKKMIELIKKIRNLSESII